jgi:hypothetical protein
MPPSAMYYFDANLTNGRDFIRGLPMYAIHAGSSYDGGWQSNSITGFGGFQHMLWTVNVQVPLHIAMPRMVANQNFGLNKEFQKLAIYAFKPMPGASWQADGGYLVGASIALVIKEFRVVKHTPIMQWKGLPALAQVQRNVLEKRLGRETYAPVAVTLEVFGDCDAVE